MALWGCLKLHCPSINEILLRVPPVLHGVGGQFKKKITALTFCVHVVGEPLGCVGALLGLFSSKSLVVLEKEAITTLSQTSPAPPILSRLQLHPETAEWGGGRALSRAAGHPVWHPCQRSPRFYIVPAY